MVEIMKAAYCKTLHQFYSVKACDGPWTREWVTRIVTMMNNNMEILDRKWNVYQTNLKDMFCTLTQENEGENLRKIIKLTENNITTIPVVPWEDSFEIVREAHLSSNHGGLTETMNLIKPYYYVNLIFVKTLLDLCKCQKVKNESSIHHNIKGFLQILDMREFPDKGFNYILIYNDLQTGLTQLRPLAKVNELEISFELVNIFTDFGPPKKLIVYEPYFYDNVINNVNKIFYPCKIDLEFDMADEKVSNRLEQVKIMLNVWMKTNNSTNWAVGCYLVQWKMNVIQRNNKKPYCLVFGRNTMKEKPNYSKTTLDTVNFEEVIGLDSDDSSNQMCNVKINSGVQDIEIEVPSLTMDDFEVTIDNTENTLNDSNINLYKQQHSYQAEYIKFKANSDDIQSIDIEDSSDDSTPIELVEIELEPNVITNNVKLEVNELLSGIQSGDSKQVL